MAAGGGRPGPAARVVMAAVLALIPAIPARQPRAAPALVGEPACTPYLAEAERHYQLPAGLLRAVAMTESGQSGQPYPWALNIAGQPVMAASFQDAAGLLRRADGRPRQDAAVGCMQIHLRYHLDAVETPEWVLQPRNNVWYAAGFLRQLHDQYGDWRVAVGHYNANDPAARRLYLCQVSRWLRQLSPATAQLLDFPTDCAGPPRRGGETQPRRAGGWGWVVVGQAGAAPAVVGLARPVAPPAGKLITLGSAHVVRPARSTTNRSGTNPSGCGGGSGPLILRPGACGYFSR